MNKPWKPPSAPLLPAKACWTVATWPRCLPGAPQRPDLELLDQQLPAGRNRQRSTSVLEQRQHARLPPRCMAVAGLLQAQPLSHPGEPGSVRARLSICRRSRWTSFSAGINDHITPWDGIVSLHTIAGRRAALRTPTTAGISESSTAKDVPKASFVENPKLSGDPRAGYDASHVGAGGRSGWRGFNAPACSAKPDRPGQPELPTDGLGAGHLC